VVFILLLFVLQTTNVGLVFLHSKKSLGKFHFHERSKYILLEDRQYIERFFTLSKVLTCQKHHAPDYPCCLHTPCKPKLEANDKDSFGWCMTSHSILRHCKSPLEQNIIKPCIHRKFVH
jgi:hypothetical protein